MYGFDFWFYTIILCHGKSASTECNSYRCVAQGDPWPDTGLCIVSCLLSGLKRQHWLITKAYFSFIARYFKAYLIGFQNGSKLILLIKQEQIAVNLNLMKPGVCRMNNRKMNQFTTNMTIIQWLTDCFMHILLWLDL